MTDQRPSRGRPPSGQRIRKQVMLDPDQVEKIAAIAEKEKQSESEVMRSLIDASLKRKR
jgi:hypothetical protein